MKMHRHRLQAPTEHLGVLMEPAAAEISALLRRSAADSSVFEIARVLDRPLVAWRAPLRADLGLTPPVVITGHQAEFFHAGVLAKNLAARALTSVQGGSAAFVLVDSDVPKRASLRVPEITRAGLRVVELPIPALDPNSPMQYQPPAARAAWLDFFTAAAGRLEHYDRSALKEFSSAWLADQDSIDFCSGFERGRIAVETAITGAALPGISVSRLCQTDAFCAFLAQIVPNARAFAEAHNAARDAYRLRYKVRNWQRPVPALQITPDRCELPFWAQRPGARRRRLWASGDVTGITLFADQEPIATLSSAAMRDLDAFKRLTIANGPWEIRPRALTLSAFIRLFVADLFIHGIGGAKYDEITDPLLESFFGFRASPYCCVTATVHLPLPAFGASVAELRAARRRERDFQHNPQRYVSPPAAVLDQLQQKIAESRQLRVEQAPRTDRRAVHRSIIALKHEIAAGSDGFVLRLAEQSAEKEEQLALDAIARDREYFFGLHPRHTLGALWSKVERLTRGTTAEEISSPGRSNQMTDSIS